MTERLYTVHQVARMLGTDGQEVAQWMQKAWLPFRRLGEGEIRISETNLVDFLKAQGIDIQMVLKGAGVEPEQERAGEGTDARPEAAGDTPLRVPAERHASDDAEAARAANRAPGRSVSEARDRPPHEPSALSQPVSGPVSEVDAADFLLEHERDSVDSSDAKPPESTGAIALRVLAEKPTPEEDDRDYADDGVPERPGLSEAPAVPAEHVTVTVPPGREAVQPDAEPGPLHTVAQVAEAVFRDAIARRADQIHLDADAQGLRLWQRRDGVLQERPAFKQRLPAGMSPQLLAHLKTLAGLDAQASRVQKGSFTATIDGSQQRFDLVVCPTRSGERLALHLCQAARPMGLSELAMGPSDEQRVRQLLATSGAMIVLAGPARSGKSTLLRAMLADRADPGRLVALLESEETPAIADVVAAGGGAMAQSVEAFALQGADVIATADLPDAATCGALLNAAKGGATVLSAMRARDCLSAMELLWELGVDRWELSFSLGAVISQRPMRRLCPACRQAIAPRDIPRQWASALEGQGTIYAAGGCPRCSRTGYSGRTGAFSILYVDGAVASALRKGEDIHAIAAAAEAAGWPSLLEAALDKVRSGVTSLEELSRVLPTAP